MQLGAFICIIRNKKGLKVCYHWFALEPTHSAAEVGHNLVYNCSAQVGDLLNIHSAIRAVESVAIDNDFFANLRVWQIGEVNHAMIHTDIAYNRAAIAANGNKKAIGKGPGEPVGKAKGQQANDRVP